MGELELTRTAGDRRLYELAGVGTVRLNGFLARTASVEARGRIWAISRSGLLQRRIEAADATGQTVGRFAPHGVHRGGTLQWFGRELELRPVSRWRERYALADGARELAVIEGRGWGRRPVRVSVDDPGALDPGLLLFAAFITRAVAQEAGGSG